MKVNITHLVLPQKTHKDACNEGGIKYDGTDNRKGQEIK